MGQGHRTGGLSKGVHIGRDVEELLWLAQNNGKSETNVDTGDTVEMGTPAIDARVSGCK